MYNKESYLQDNDCSFCLLNIEGDCSSFSPIVNSVYLTIEVVTDIGSVWERVD